MDRKRWSWSGNNKSTSRWSCSVFQVIWKPGGGNPSGNLDNSFYIQQLGFHFIRWNIILPNTNVMYITYFLCRVYNHGAYLRRESCFSKSLLRLKSFESKIFYSKHCHVYIMWNNKTIVEIFVLFNMNLYFDLVWPQIASSEYLILINIYKQYN